MKLLLDHLVFEGRGDVALRNFFRVVSEYSKVGGANNRFSHIFPDGSLGSRVAVTPSPSRIRRSFEKEIESENKLGN